MDAGRAILCRGLCVVQLGDRIALKAVRSAWRRVEDYLRDANPEFILFQCGADSLEGDPITQLNYTEAAHAEAATSLCQIADEYCEGRIIGTGGGGYNRRNLARAWTRVVQSFVAAG